MDYNLLKMGKIRSIDYNEGLGKIVTKDSEYTFLINNQNKHIKVGDMVAFRAEQVHDNNIAFFVRIYDPKMKSNLHNKVLRSKTYYNKKG